MCFELSTHTHPFPIHWPRRAPLSYLLHTPWPRPMAAPTYPCRRLLQHAYGAVKSLVSLNLNCGPLKLWGLEKEAQLIKAAAELKQLVSQSMCSRAHSSHARARSILEDSLLHIAY
jgi:hypothetical protein